jgi:hypothetical protein
MAHLRYARLCGYCRNENASSSSFLPKGLPSPKPPSSVRQPDYLPKETRGFASPTRDGFALSQRSSEKKMRLL